MSSRRGALGALLVVAGCIVPSCKQAPPPTQVMIVLDADRAAIPRIRAVTIAVSGRAADEERFGRAETERFEPAADDWPIQFGILPKGNDARRRYRVVATALGADDAPLSRVVAEGGFLKGVVSMLSLRFDAACIERELLCEPDQTCTRGVCSDVVEGELVPFAEPGRGEPHARDGGTLDADVAAGAGGSGAGAGASGAGGEGRDAAVDDPCSSDNGGCAPDQQCSSDGGRTECLPCPSGSIGDDGRCGPTLLGLQLSRGTLAPAFDGQTTEYTIELPLLVRQIEIVASAAAGAALTIDEQPVESGQAWTTPVLPYGPLPLHVRVADAAGAARVYRVVLERKGAQTAYLKASNADAEDDFGRSVAVSGDTVVVGAIYEDSSAEGVDQDASDNAARDSGAVYVFERDALGAFRQTAYLKPSDTRANGIFGSAVDLDGDTLLVGAIGGSDRVLGGGAAYVFVREAGRWREQAKLEPDDGLANDWFGVAVALEGDTAIVAAPDRSRGAVYAYARTGDGWALAQRFTQEDAPAGTRFGAALHLRGDRLLVGAPEDSSAVTQGGAAYVFERSAGTWSQVQELRPASPRARDWFGFAVAGDAESIVVGAPQRDDEGADTGAAYGFAKRGAVWEQRQVVEPTSERGETLFGSSVLLAPDGFLLVGAQGEFDGGRGVGAPPAPGDDAAPYSGGVYVFRREADRFVVDSYLKAGNRGADDAFGYVLDAGAGRVVVGALLESSDARTVDGDGNNNGRRQSGAAYVFE